MQLPQIIQGGMGVGVSGWRLARAVSCAGGLGVVAGTAMDVLLARRLEAGDPSGHLRRALAALPLPGVARRVLDGWFRPGGLAEGEPFGNLPPLALPLSRERTELIVAANFAEVWLAREGHAAPVGINYLEKIQLPTLPSLWGAMLAGVGYVLMGAGLPHSIPHVLDELAAGRAVSLGLDVQGAARREREELHFDPQTFGAGESAWVRPHFLAIVSSAAVAGVLARRAEGHVDGFVVEGDVAGGHNAPPRTSLVEHGPERELASMVALGRPFWLAGGRARPESLREALELGATGIQVGSAFAFCRESGLDPGLRARVVEAVLARTAHVRTDLRASPTGFPFKLLELPGTLSDPACVAARRRVCDLGFLRQAWRRPEGRVGWRCPGEPESSWLRKQGLPGETVGRLCLCNGLLANVGLGQRRRQGPNEVPLLTAGSQLEVVAECAATAGRDYAAADVLERLRGPRPPPPQAS